MTSKQISVFIENRKGRLKEILRVLKDADVNILSMSLADTAEYGLLRIIADKAESGKTALTAAGFSCMLSDVFILRIPHVPGALQGILEVIADEELNVEYMYGLSAAAEGASIVVKISNAVGAEDAFKRHGIQTLNGFELVN